MSLKILSVFLLVKACHIRNHYFKRLFEVHFSYIIFLKDTYSRPIGFVFFLPASDLIPEYYIGETVIAIHFKTKHEPIIKTQLFLLWARARYK